MTSPTPPPAPPTGGTAPLRPLTAGALVFFVSGAVLVLEILAARLLAPYVGLSLETYTAIIGVVLAGISLGTWAGGRLADAVEPRRILGATVALGGLLSLATLPAVRVLGGVAEGRAWYASVLATGLTFFLPAAALSAVNPLVVKLQLQRLERTGQVVGRLSALGTAGAIAGTFLTGFVLLPAFRTSRVVLVLGLCLVATGCALMAMHARRRRMLFALLLLATAALVGLGLRSEGRCDVETAYFCANVRADFGARDPSRRVLALDNLLHGYVDLDDPKFLGLIYTRRMGDVADAVRPGGDAVDALHIGGGGFAIPRYIAATRPGSTNVILELDPGVARLAKTQLGLRTGPRMRIHTGDARVTVRGLPDQAYDLVFGDAFAGVAIPWHLTTHEAIEEVRRTLRPHGVYILNLIDRPPLDFLRAEARTLGGSFRNVALIAHSSLLSGVVGGSNYILIASDARIPIGHIRARVARHRTGDAVVIGETLQRFIGDAVALTDDYAPADQLLTR